jgi:hypothetical protein
MLRKRQHRGHDAPTVLAFRHVKLKMAEPLQVEADSLMHWKQRILTLFVGGVRQFERVNCAPEL